MVSKTQGKDAVPRLKNDVEEVTHVSQMLPDELILTGRSVDEKAERERQAGCGGKETNRLRDAVFLNAEAVLIKLSEVRDKTATGVVYRERESDEMCFGMKYGRLRE